MDYNVDSHHYHGNVHCGDACYAIKGSQHYGGTALKISYTWWATVLPREVATLSLPEHVTDFVQGCSRFRRLCLLRTASTLARGGGAALHALAVDLEGQGLDLLLHVVGEQVAEGHGCSEVLRCIRE